MFEPDGRIARPPRPFALLIAVLLVGFFGLTGTLIWAASSGGSGGFMGGGRPPAVPRHAPAEPVFTPTRSKPADYRTLIDAPR